MDNQIIIPEHIANAAERLKYIRNHYTAPVSPISLNIAFRQLLVLALTIPEIEVSIEGQEIKLSLNSPLVDSTLIISYDPNRCHENGQVYLLFTILHPDKTGTSEFCIPTQIIQFGNLVKIIYCYLKEMADNPLYTGLLPEVWQDAVDNAIDVITPEVMNSFWNGSITAVDLVVKCGMPSMSSEAATSYFSSTT